MNDRQRFAATMHYQPRDRAPLYDFNFWDETLPEWHQQGLPEKIDRTNTAGYFGLDASLGGGDAHWHTACNVGLCPGFDNLVLEDRGDHELAQQSDGVRVLRKKYLGSIPHPEKYLLCDRESWEREYKWRLNPAHPDRFPPQILESGKTRFYAGSTGITQRRDHSEMTWDDHVALWCDPERPHPIVLPGGSLYGVLRNWMGVENLSLLIYDDPELFEEMVTTLADCIVGVLERILATGGQFEACCMWEDMCYNAGPLISPTHFSQFLVPHYMRITALLRKYGVDIVWIDCDGLIDHLVPLWLEAGVNCMFPIEVGTWQADPLQFRKEYGKDLRMMGGFDKHILSHSKDAITREIERLAPLVEEGGFIPMPDHRVPPDVPLDHYIHYSDTARRIWGRGLNLPVKSS